MTRILQVHTHYREAGGEDEAAAADARLLADAGHEVLRYRAWNARAAPKAAAQLAVSAWNPSVGTCVDLAAHGWPNGRAKSAINTGSQTARLYTTTNCTGTAFQIFPRGPYPSINFSSNSVYVF